MTFKKNKQTDKSMRSTKHPTVHFLFYHLCSKDGEGGSRKGKWQWQADPPDQANKSAVQKEFCWRRRLFFFFSVQRSSHWSCRSSQSCAPRTRRVNVLSAISQTTTKKNFFLLLFMGTSSDPSTTPTKSQQCPSQYIKKKRELLFPAHISLSQKVFKSAVLFLFFFYLSSQILL